MVILILPAATSWSANKQGSKCSTLGKTQVSKNLKYSCVKKNGKLVWSKGVPIPSKTKLASATPTPTPTPTPQPSSEPSINPTPTAEPTPTPKPSISASARTTWEKALAEIERAYKDATDVNINFKFIISNDANKKFEPFLKETIQKSARLWGALYQPKGEFPVILGNSKDMDWVKRELGNYGHTLSDWDINLIKEQGSRSSRGYVEVNSKNAITFYIIGDDYQSPDMHTRAFISHEYVHSVQVSYYQSRLTGIPRWAIEGSAQFFGNAIASIMSENSELTYSKIRRDSAGSGSLALHSLTRDELYKVMLSIENGEDRNMCAEPKLVCYTAGAIFTEKLIADYGFQKFSDWWRISSNKNWYPAFEEAFGINLDLWYQEFGIPHLQEVSKEAKPEVSAPSPNTYTLKPKRITDPIERWEVSGSNALNVFRKWGTTKSGEMPKTNVEFSFSSKFWKDLEVQLRARFNSIVSYFDRYITIDIPIYFMAGTKDDLDWICRLLESKDSSRTYANCIKNESEALRSENTVARGFDLRNGSANFYVMNYQQVNDSLSFRPRVEHEYFHSVQQSLLKGKYRTDIPCWYLEGGAEYLGVLTFSHGNAEEFLKLRRLIILNAPERRSSNVTALDLTQWLTAASVAWQDTPTGGDNCAPYRSNGLYHDATLATEWLIDRIGVDGLLSLTKAAGETTWNSAFEKFTGLSVKEGYKLIGEYMLKERKIAEQNSWLEVLICTDPERPRPDKSPPGCWFW
jgi:hypothetical protein